MDFKIRLRIRQIYYYIIHFILYNIVVPIIKKLWIAEITGLEKIPKEGAAIIALNHQSYLDFLCFSAICHRKIRYLTAEKFYKSRIWRPIMEATRQIKVERTINDKTEVYTQVAETLNRGEIIGIFPEGTRSHDGEIKKPYKGVAKYALKHKVPVIPVGIDGTFNIWPRHRKFPLFTEKCKIMIGEMIYFDQHYNKEHTDEILWEVTHTIMIRISNLAGKKYKHNFDSNSKINEK